MDMNEWSTLTKLTFPDHLPFLGGLETTWAIFEAAYNSRLLRIRRNGTRRLSGGGDSV